jgi:hypothetical protein
MRAAHPSRLAAALVTLSFLSSAQVPRDLFGSIPQRTVVRTDSPKAAQSFLSDHPRFSFFSRDPVLPETVSSLLARSSGRFDGPIQDLVNVNAANIYAPLHESFAGGVVMHLAHKRLEIFGTVGGLFVPYRTMYTMPNAWLYQTDIGVRWALDPNRHLWIGGTGHYITDFSDKKRQWAYESADFTVQFGR